MKAKQQITEWKAQLGKQLGEAFDAAPEVSNAKVTFNVNGNTGLNFEMRLVNDRTLLLDMADKINKVSPKASILRCARAPRSLRTPLDEALAVYGTIENAFPSLKRQLENAPALGLDYRQQQKLDHLVWMLEEHLVKTHDSNRQP